VSQYRWLEIVYIMCPFVTNPGVIEETLLHPTALQCKCTLVRADVDDDAISKAACPSMAACSLSRL